MKTIAFYLPQFHAIPENDEWWGKGFTEWVNVKKARPLFDGHLQPRIPKHYDYYDLSDVNVMRRQASFAKEHGVYGFCFYHYWFNGHKLLEKPVENYLYTQDIDFPYCISWANEHWTNQWVSDDLKVLIEQQYGEEEEWKEHFNYLLPFFKDPRYIKIDGKPIFIIYKPELIDCRQKMINCWKEEAKRAGIEDIIFIYQRSDCILNGLNIDLSMFDYGIEYQPLTAMKLINERNLNFRHLRRAKKKMAVFLEKTTKTTSAALNLREYKKPQLKKYGYDEVWESILKMEPITPTSIPCAFVNWDNTPRRAERGSVVVGCSPEKFKYYYKQLVIKTRNDYKKDIMFLFAWNEWAEGGILEPDEEYQFGFLEAIKDSLEELKELPIHCL